MDYEAVGNSYIDAGTSLLALGAFLTSLGWFLLGTYKQTDEWLKKWHRLKSDMLRRVIVFVCAVALLIPGLHMIGEGGTLTTKGWNTLNTSERRASLIGAVTHELFINTIHLSKSPIKGETHYIKEDGTQAMRPFPTLRTSALNAVLASGLWGFRDAQDQELLGLVLDYEGKATIANYMFRQYNDSIMRISDPNEEVKAAKKIQSVIPERDFFKSLIIEQNKLMTSVMNAQN